MSKEAVYAPPKAIRGGIPICWPQFGDMGPCKQQHGFARNREWTVAEQTQPNSVTLTLKDDTHSITDFASAFELFMTLTIRGNTLRQELVVKNIGDVDFPFTAALHTYFTTGDITKTSITGLKGCKYLDSLENRVEKTETGDQDVVFDGEVDRIYCGIPDNNVEIIDASRNRKIKVSKSNFPDAVVWNPHIAKSAGMSDFGNDEWKEMVCLEVAQAGSGPVTVPAQGGEWRGSQTLELVLQ